MHPNAENCDCYLTWQRWIYVAWRFRLLSADFPIGRLFCIITWVPIVREGGWRQGQRMGHEKNSTGSGWLWRWRKRAVSQGKLQPLEARNRPQLAASKTDLDPTTTRKWKKFCQQPEWGWGMPSPLEPPERNAALLTPWFRLATYGGLREYKFVLLSASTFVVICFGRIGN